MKELKISLERARAIVGGRMDNCVNQMELDMLVDELVEMVEEER